MADRCFTDTANQLSVTAATIAPAAAVMDAFNTTHKIRHPFYLRQCSRGEFGNWPARIDQGTDVEMISHSLIRVAPARAAAHAAFVLLAAVGIFACSDAAGPRPVGPTVRIVPVADSAFEGDVVRLSAAVLDDSGAEVTGALVTWTVGDTTLARSAGDGSFELLRPGTAHITARSGAVTGTYDLVIGRLVVKRVDLAPGTMDLGRGDIVEVSALVFGQGDRAITGRTVTFASDDTLVAVIGSAGNDIGAPGFLIAVGPGSTTVRASVDGVTGTAHASVVIADTTFTLVQYNGSPVPVLLATDSIVVDGVSEVYEQYAEPGSLVLSGLLQLRYQLDVRLSRYRVVRIGDTVQRELRFQQRQFDRGIVTVGPDGNLAMTSEFIFPLDHTAALEPDGFLVHYRIPGTDSFLDLRYRRQAP